MKVNKLYLLVLVLIIVAFVLTSCAPPAEPAEEEAPAAEEPAVEEEPEEKEMVKLSLRLPWIKNAQAAGPFCALEKGYFAEEGLDVEINAGGPDANSITLVAAGSDTFGLHDTNSLTLARAEGLPLVTLAAFWQKHPGCVFALKESGIEELKDFEGKKLGFKEGGPWTLTQAMLTAHGVDLDSIEQISVGFDVSPILEGQVDLFTGFATNEPLQVAREGKEAVVFLPFDYGIETSTEALFTTEEYLAANPDVACGMVRAIRRGWEYALANKEDAINIVLKYGGEELDFDLQMEQLIAQEDFIVTPDTEKYGIGYMTEERWQIGEDVLKEQGLLEIDVDVTEAFSMQCLEE